ncbi:hypothetical protein PPROV_000560900 [Pycnococcus provasolii]|uniref:Chloride channel protein n=1 Tax=Pycnococcus provasolii TaxID=41880 RepID=A0A830HJG1_9CHLO|nr:hypothetical protein PPROV_000560900 [Pycnococcus provasolii]
MRCGIGIGIASVARPKGCPQETAEAEEVEGITYLPPNSLAYRRAVLADRTRPHTFRNSSRQAMMVLIGIAVGLVGFLLYWCIDVIADWRHGITKQLLEDGQRSVALAWLFSAFIASCLAVGAASIVVFVSPEAAGSGVPEVMAYLNGSMLPRGFDMRTLLAKFFSAALAVASGLPVGPEGPMIYLGAMLGSQLSRRIGQRMARLGTFFENLTSNKDARDFTVAGAAAGVAVAFSAPIGGLLFAFEEVAGYFRVSLKDIHGTENTSVFHLNNAAFFREGVSPLGDSVTAGSGWARKSAPRLAARCDDTATNHDTASLTTTERESATGATVWDAAVALARYIHAHRQLVNNCRVVELGAGCGLVGIAAAHCGASHVVLTDREELQPLLRTNACGDLPTAVDVHVFDWSDEKDLAPRADVVLASEVAYDEEVVPQLVNAASRCLQGRGVLLASFDGAVGRHSANRALLTTLADRGWNVRVEPGGAWLHRDTISVVLATPPPQSS